MTPLVFGGRFGWLHAGQGSHGVVLCNPFGHEEAWGHKAMRYLAEELSRRDIPVLRFDGFTRLGQGGPALLMRTARDEEGRKAPSQKCPYRHSGMDSIS